MTTTLRAYDREEMSVIIDYYATRVRPGGDERDYRKAWIIQVFGPVLPRLGPYYLLLVLNHALPRALILVKPWAYEAYGAWRG
jgi:hypothetical protein